MANTQVISQIKEKINSSGDQALYHIGPELKYVGALLSSNNNNLEEQLLIGVDRIVKEQTEVDIDQHDIKKTKIEFRKPNDTENYYILEISEYDPEAGMGNIYVRGQNIYLQEIMSADESDNSAHEDEYNESLYYEDNGLHIAPDIIIENSILSQKPAINEVTKQVSIKNTFQSYETINNNTVRVLKEVITNVLS